MPEPGGLPFFCLPPRLHRQDRVQATDPDLAAVAHARPHLQVIIPLLDVRRIQKDQLAGLVFLHLGNPRLLPAAGLGRDQEDALVGLGRVELQAVAIERSLKGEG